MPATRACALRGLNPTLFSHTGSAGRALSSRADEWRLRDAFLGQRLYIVDTA